MANLLRKLCSSQRAPTLRREESRRTHPDLHELTPLQATAAISAVNEIVSITLLRDGIDGITTVSDELVAITIAFLTADPRSAA